MVSEFRGFRGGGCPKGSKGGRVSRASTQGSRLSVLGFVCDEVNKEKGVTQH